MILGNPWCELTDIVTRVRLAVVLVVLTFSGIPLAWGQNAGRIHGTVTDPTRAVVPAVSVTAIDSGTGATHPTTADSMGRFELIQLPIGPYIVEVNAPGFKPASFRDLVLHIGEDLQLDVKLQLSGTVVEVVVSAAPPLTQTSSVEIGNVIAGPDVHELPLNGRNVLQLALLAPGAAGAAPGNGIETFSFTSGGFTVSINGGRTDENEYLLDGVWDEAVYFNQQNILPTVDVVSEFRVRGTDADAASGFGHGGIITYATRSGENDLHGKAWEFLRNDVLDARNVFDQKKPPFRQNQFGGILSGPFRKDHTFFMLSYEGLRIRKGLTALNTIPTAAEISGDFSADKPIFDPLTTRPDPSHPGQFIRSQFPGNIVPPDRISPASKFIASSFPTTNVGGVGNVVNNAEETETRDQYNIRIDHKLGDKDQLFARGTIANFFGVEPLGGTISETPPFNPPNLPTTETALSRNIALGWIHTFSSAFLNDFRFGFNRAKMPRKQEGPDFFGMFNIPGSNRDPADFGIPDVTAVGFSDFGGTDTITPFILTENDFHYLDSVSLVKGHHTLDFGFAFLRTQLVHQFDFFSKTDTTFSGALTADPQNPASAGNSFADFLLGTPAVVVAGVGSTASHSFEYRVESYINDAWRLNRRLTLITGLRYDLLRPALFHESLSALDLKTGNIVVSVPGHGPLPPQVNKFIPAGANFVTAHAAGFPATLVDTDTDNFGPRVGLAYDIQGNGKTVVRAGYGLYYAQRQQVNSTAEFRADIPFYDISVAVAPGPTPSQLTPTLTWDNLLANPIATLGGTTIPRNFPLGEVHQWSLSVQRQLLSDTGIELDYIASSGHHLPVPYTANQVDVLGEVYPRGTRPFPHLGNFISERAAGNSAYNAFIGNVRQRFHSGLSFQLGYTWSHSIDTTASDENVSGGSENFAQDAYALEKSERGNSTFDIRHRFILSYLYELPIGPTKRFFNGTGASDKMLKGWRIGGITTYATGVPVTAAFAVDPTGNGLLAVRPNQIADPNRNAPHTPEEWFNTTAFQIQSRPIFGDAGRNDIRGPGIKNWDVTVAKSTVLHEKCVLEFRTDLFNAFNTPQFLLPIRNIDSPDFGKIFQARDPRQIQFSLSLLF